MSKSKFNVVLWDCVGIAVTWVLLAIGALLIRHEAQMVITFLSTFFLGPATAIWIQARLAPAIFPLTDRARREELATTLLTPGEYLTPIIKPRIIRLTAPVWSVFPVLAILGLLALLNTKFRKNDSEMIVVLVTANLAAAFLGISNVVLSFGGIFLLMSRLCLSRRGSAGYKTLIPFASAILAILAPLIIFIVFAMISLYSAREPDGIAGALIANTVCALLLMLISIPIARALWRKALRDYFEFRE